MTETNEKLYLKDVFNIDEYLTEGKTKIFIASGVCSRKSTYVKEELTKKGSVLFVTSRRAKVDEDEKNSDFKNKFEWYFEGNQYLVTNSGLAYRVKASVILGSKDKLNDFLDHFDYVVIDEVHSITTDSTFADSSYEVLKFIEYVAEINKPIIAMTGTPEPIEYYFKENDWTMLDFRKICNYVHPKKVKLIRFREVISIIKNWENQVVYFANHTKDMIELGKMLIAETDIKPNEIAMIVSQDREEEFNGKLTENNAIGKNNADLICEISKKTYQRIIEKQRMPDECKMLISTSTLREGIDIENENMILFCENHILSNVIQFFGRVRGSAEVAYIIADSNDHTVKIDTLLYNHAKTIVDIENEFLKKEIDLYSVADISNKNKLIRHVTKDNPYMRYDYINNCFAVFDMRYQEEQRLLKQKYWKDAIVKHCKEYGIPHHCFDADEIRKFILTDISLHKDYKFFGDEQNIVIRLIEGAYGITDKQPDKINKALEKKKADIRIKNERDFTKNAPKRGQTYWQLENTMDCTDFSCTYI